MSQSKEKKKKKKEQSIEKGKKKKKANQKITTIFAFPLSDFRQGQTAKEKETKQYLPRTADGKLA